MVLRTLMIAAVLAIAAPAFSTAAMAEAKRAELACTLCDGLAALMTGEPEQAFVFRSFEPANGGSKLHPALDNTGLPALPMTTRWR